MNRLESIAFWKKFALVPALVLASLFTVSAQRIASVDINQILESLDEYKTAQDNLDKVAAQWRQDIAQEYDQIRGLYNRYQAEQVLMSDDARAKKESWSAKKQFATYRKTSSAPKENCSSAGRKWSNPYRIKSTLPSRNTPTNRAMILSSTGEAPQGSFSPTPATTKQPISSNG